MPTVTIAQATVQITAAPAPVLFPDTCALVDLVRLPIRKDGPTVTRELLAARALLAAATADPTGLWVVVPPRVPAEWDEHAPEAAALLASSWSKMDEACATTGAAAAAMGVAALPPESLEATFDPVRQSLSRLSRGFLEVGVRLASDSPCDSAAFRRACDGVAPGHRGGSIKDCVIAEHVLAVSRLLGSGFAHPRVLLTSNTKDFCVAKDNTAPRPPLDDDLMAVQTSLTTTWEWAKSTLGV